MTLNLVATFQTLKHLVHPTTFLPHLTISTFAHLPIPLSAALQQSQSLPFKPNIQAVVLDKDNCFATPYALEIHPTNRAKFADLRAAFPGDRLLIVSNSSGTEAKDPGFKEGRILEERLGVRVLRHELHKPGCGDEVMKFFKDADIGVKGPENVAIVGDRVFTDVLMANMMGAWAVWVRDGVPGAKGSFFERIERTLVSTMERRGYRPPIPRP